MHGLHHGATPLLGVSFNEHSPNECVPCDTANLLPVYWKNFFLDTQRPRCWYVYPRDTFQGEMGNKLNVQQRQIG